MRNNVKVGLFHLSNYFVLTFFKKIRTRYLMDTEGNNTLENLMANEAHQKKRVATEAIVWLKR